MKEITEDYCDFETAKLLKEKGMNESCSKHYVQKNNNDGTSEAVTVCTLQMAMKWLREVHKIFVSIDYSHICEQFNYTICLKDSSLRKCDAHVDYIFNSYESACEAAIKYCLENLI